MESRRKPGFFMILFRSFFFRWKNHWKFTFYRSFRANLFFLVALHRVRPQCAQRAYFHFYDEFVTSEDWLFVNVSMPSTGLLPFLHYERRTYNMSNFVSMPSTGLLPFLQKGHLWLKQTQQTCQCPQRAYFHFYSICDVAILANYLVSMPSTGLLPFLRRWLIQGWDRRQMCQCPQRAYFHFYFIMLKISLRLQCVNALNGLTSISTVASRNPWFYSMSLTLAKSRNRKYL